MKLKKIHQIDKVCSTATSRTILNHPWIERIDGKLRLVGTDGKMMAVVPVEVDDVDQCILAKTVPVTAIKAARAKAKKSQRELSITLSDTMAVVDGSHHSRLLGEPPKMQRILEDTRDHTKQSFKIHINAAQLHAIAQALGTNRVTVTIDMEGKCAFQVRPCEKDGQGEIDPECVGILMPCL